jgi:dTDP-6-deoxy-L-talose 4-dehydrogenase (NAD+)
MKKVLVTGATGFIGHYVIHELLSKDCSIIATATASAKAETKDWWDKVSFIPHIIGCETEGENLFKKFGEPDHIIHLAWRGLPNYKSLFHFEEVLPQQYFFLQNLVTNGAKSITITGTCFEYGMKERCLSEEMLPEPANPYALAKNTLRLFLQELQKHNPFLLKWVRLFYMYGKGQNPKSLIAQLDKALENDEKVFNMSGGEQLRDYLSVEDVAKNIVAMAFNKNAMGVVNCCSGNPISVKEFVENYLKEINRHIYLNLGYYPYPDYEPMRFWGDTHKLNEITNYYDLYR